MNDKFPLRVRQMLCLSRGWLAEGKALATLFGCKFIETSAKNRINVDEAFYSLVREIRRFNKVISPQNTSLGLTLSKPALIGCLPIRCQTKWRTTPIRTGTIRRQWLLRHEMLRHVTPSPHRRPLSTIPDALKKLPTSIPVYLISPWSNCIIRPHRTLFPQPENSFTSFVTLLFSLLFFFSSIVFFCVGL